MWSASRDSKGLTGGNHKDLSQELNETAHPAVVLQKQDNI